MMSHARITACALFFGLLAAPAFAQDVALTFDRPQSLHGLKTTGPVSIDTNRKHAGSGALKLGPQSTVIVPLCKTDGTGKVDLWVYAPFLATACTYTESDSRAQV